VMEVQRSKLRELGFNFVIGGENYFVGNSIGGIAPMSGPTALTAGAAPVTGVAGRFGLDRLRSVVRNHQQHHNISGIREGPAI